jgi:hypothetical protein
MEWTAIAGGVVACLNVINLLVSWKSKGDIAELKLSVTERLVESEKETREWVEREFARKETVQTQLEALKMTR